MANMDILVVVAAGEMFDATLTTTAVPACEVGPAHKKYHYQVMGKNTGWGYSRREAREELMAYCAKAGWRVLKPL